MPRSIDLQPGLSRATSFLLRARDRASGLWQDFPSITGPGSEWVTGFVLASLAGQEYPGFGEARQRLIGLQRADGSWGFCSQVPGDADSTAWAVLGLGSAMSVDSSSRARAFLLARQCRGGFCTYPATAASGLPASRGSPPTHTAFPPRGTGSRRSRPPVA